MICRSCNRTLPERARYCVHCGAEQELPTPIALAAAMAGVRGEAANAVYAEAAPRGRGDARGSDMRGTGIPPSSDAQRAANDLRAPRASGPVVPSNGLDSTPAYASAPSRYRLAVALVVACLVVGAVAVTAAWWLRPTPPLVASSAERSTSSAGAPSTSSNPAARAESAAPADQMVPAAPPTANPPPAAAEAPASSQNAAESVSPADSTPPMPVQITPLPSPHATARPHVPAHASPPKAEAPRAAEPAPPAPAPAPAPPKPRVAAALPAATAAAPVDRWARMNEETSRCTREDFIARVICTQRVRFRYCDGYWGKVPACPGSPTPERGQ